MKGVCGVVLSGVCEVVVVVTVEGGNESVKGVVVVLVFLTVGVNER